MPRPLLCNPLHNRLMLFCFHSPFVILPELPAQWCITYPTCTRHSAGNRRHLGSSLEQNDFMAIFSQIAEAALLGFQTKQIPHFSILNDFQFIILTEFKAMNV
jgi:hypothetical protein